MPFVRRVKKKYGRARQATDGIRMWHMRVACRIFEAADMLVIRARLNDVYSYMACLVYFVKNA